MLCVRKYFLDWDPDLTSKNKILGRQLSLTEGEMTNKAMLFSATFNCIGCRKISLNVLIQVISCLISKAVLYINVLNLKHCLCSADSSLLSYVPILRVPS